MDLSKNNTLATLVFPVRGTGGKRKVLLAKKVRKIGIGCPNGFGGSLNKGETVKACAVRELRKESGLVAMQGDLEFVGVMRFHNKREKKNGGGWFVVTVFVFILNKWIGKLKLKKDEMVDDKWYKIYRLPRKKMMPADQFWVPLIFNGNKIKGEAWYGPKQKTMPRLPEIKVVAHLSDVD